MRAVVLAGGGARRLDGVDKVMLQVGGQSLLDWALDAVSDAASIVVVGPARSVARPVRWAREDPPGGGPVAALAAGLKALGAQEQSARTTRTELVAVLAADQPGITAQTVHRLAAVVADDLEVAGAVLVDPEGHTQWLAGVWRLSALAAALPPQPERMALRAVLGRLPAFRLPARPVETEDVDTPDDLRRWQARYSG